ncbi:MAG: 30S ribosomal protein S20 [bacterium]|nr:30S ribosomal protein S20 [bacterium]
MPLLNNAKKALRSSLRKAEVNQRVKSRTKTSLDAMRQKPSAENMATAFSSVDRAVKHHLIHRNKAARIKHQLSKLMSA